MCAKLVDKRDQARIEHFAGQIEKHIFRERNGSVGFDGFGPDIYFSAMESFIEFHPDIPPNERYGLLYSSIVQSIKNGPLKVKLLLGHLSEQENKFLRREKRKYVLVTQLSVPFFQQLNSSKFSKRIKFSLELGKRFDRMIFREQVRNINLPYSVEGYTFVRIKCQGITPNGAFDSAIDLLDLMRGIWNLSQRRFVISHYSVAGPAPINKIRLGPFHSLHDSKGVGLAEVFWYEPGFRHESCPIESKWAEFSDFEKIINASLRYHRYRATVENWLRRYVRALDHNDHHSSFIELWSLLEKLTGISNADNERLIRRTSFIFANHELHVQILEHLRRFRNNHVHDSYRSDRVTQYLYQLKFYVEKLLRFHINNHFNLNGEDEFVEFLDQPVMVVKLDERIELLKMKLSTSKKAKAFRVS